jgi:hypothetical protein
LLPRHHNLACLNLVWVLNCGCTCCWLEGGKLECLVEEEEEGLQGVFKRLRRNGHQLEKGLQMAQRGPSLK